MQLSAVVLTHNSETVILKCLKSLCFCDEIVIIDDNSIDKTKSVIQTLNFKNIKIYNHALESNFAQSRNFGLDKAGGDWVLFVDSDEEVKKELAGEIKKCINDKNINGFYVKRLDIFLGKKLKYGETGNIKLLRLARKGVGIWHNKVHEIWNIDGLIGHLSTPIVHYHDLSISQFLERLNRYSTQVAEALYDRGTKESYFYHFLKPIGKFLQNYIIRLGLLDGFPGLTMAWLMSWHSLLVRMKLRLKYLKQQI